MIIGKRVGEFDRERADVVLSGQDPFDEVTMLDDDPEPPASEGDSVDRQVAAK